MEMDLMTEHMAPDRHHFISLQYCSEILWKLQTLRERERGRREYKNWCMQVLKECFFLLRGVHTISIQIHVFFRLQIRYEGRNEETTTKNGNKISKNY